MNSVEECQDAYWTALPLANPTSNTDFVPESLQYYTSTVLPAVWPAFIVIGAAAAFLLTLILWRSGRRCMLCARPRHLTQVARLSKVRALHRLRFWGAAAAVCAVGILAGVVLAGTWGGPHIVPRTFEVVAGARGYVAGTLGTADAAVADARALEATLADIQSFLGANVDEAGLDASLECLRPWLNALPNLPALLGTLDDAQTLLRGTVRPALLELQSGVADLAADVGTTADPGAATAALTHAAGSRASAVALLAQAQALVDASAALPGSADDAGAADAMGSVRDAADALLSAAAGDAPDLASKVALLGALASDLDALAETAGTAGAVTAALDVLGPAASSLLNGTLPTLAAALQGVQEGYEGVAPCVDALLAAAARVQGRVLALPAALNGQLALLGDVHAALSALSNVTSDWGAELGGLTAGLDVDAVLDGLRAPLQGVQDRLTALGNLTALAETLRNTADEAQGLAADPQSLTDVLASPDGTIPKALRLIDEVPEPASYANEAAQLVHGYAQLPFPPGSLVDDAQSEIASMLSGVDQSLVSARSVISSALDEVAAPLRDARKQVLGRIDSIVSDVRPTADRWDTVRLVVMYTVLVMIGLLSAHTAAAIWLRWPAGVKLGAALVAIFLLLAGVAVLALTAGLKVGNDGCSNLEEQVLLRLSRLERPDSALMLAKYWLLNEGSVDEVAKGVLGLDVDAVLDQISGSRDDLLEAIQNLTLRAPLQTLVNEALAATQDISTGILLLQARLDYVNVHPVYMTIKSYGCCSVLNTAGRLWLALLLVAGFGTALCVLCLPCLHSMDDVPKQGWGMRISDVCLARFARPLASQGLEAGARGVLTSASATSLAGAIVRKKSSMPEAPELQRRSDTIGAWSHNGELPEDAHSPTEWHLPPSRVHSQHDRATTEGRYLPGSRSEPDSM